MKNNKGSWYLFCEGSCVLCFVCAASQNSGLHHMGRLQYYLKDAEIIHFYKTNYQSRVQENSMHSNKKTNKKDSIIVMSKGFGLENIGLIHDLEQDLTSLDLSFSTVI